MNGAPKKWMVFWKNNQRIGSLELTEMNKRQMKSICNLTLIQRDITGTEHYEVTQKESNDGRRQGSFGQ